MKVSRTAPLAFTAEFESEEELQAEYRTNISAGGLRLPTAEKLAPFTALSVTLRLTGRGEATLGATVVAILPGAVALALQGNAEKLLESLLAEPEEKPEAPEREGNLWDRVRALSHLEKVMLAPKADRSERILLVQDNDPQVLYGLLKNPRITIDEVLRVAKSAFITYQIAELIMKTGQWINNLDVRVALIHNAKTPQVFTLRLLPGLPESEIRTISRGAATSMALKTAALKLLQGAK